MLWNEVSEEIYFATGKDCTMVRDEETYFPCSNKRR